MKKGKDYGLLIASMVAIVAIVGLVIMFSGGATGAFDRFSQEPRLVISDMEYQQGFGGNKAEGQPTGMERIHGLEEVPHSIYDGSWS